MAPSTPGARTHISTQRGGTEVSATLGFTANFTNPSTNYTNGLDSHLDLAASQFLNQQLFGGAVGYLYQQLTPDRGQRAILGSNDRARAESVRRSVTISAWAARRSTQICALTGSSNSYRRLQGHSVYATVNIPLSGLFATKPLSQCEFGEGTREPFGIPNAEWPLLGAFLPNRDRSGRSVQGWL